MYKHKSVDQRTKILNSLIKIIDNEFGISDIEVVPDSHLNNDLGLDSLDVVSFQLEIERSRNFIFDDKSEKKFQDCTIDDVINLIIDKKG